MTKTKSEISPSNDDRPEPTLIGTLLLMLYLLALVVIGFRRDAALKRSEDAQQKTLSP